MVDVEIRTEAEHILQHYLHSTDARESQLRKNAVISLWTANECPPVIALRDTRHGDNGFVYFIFSDGPLGPFFVTQYTFPDASTLRVPRR